MHIFIQTSDDDHAWFSPPFSAAPYSSKNRFDSDAALTLSGTFTAYNITTKQQLRPTVYTSALLPRPRNPLSSYHKMKENAESCGFLLILNRREQEASTLYDENCLRTAAGFTS